MTYPTTFDSFPANVNPNGDFHQREGHAEMHNNLERAINAIEAELGLNPSGSYADVASGIVDLASKVAAIRATSAKYLLFSDGTTVTAYDKSGNIVSSGTDGGAVLTACLPTASSVGSLIEFRNDGNAFPWATVPALPKEITNKLIIRGNGVRITLSSGAPRFLGFNKVADHDTFQNIEIDGFVIDAASISATAWGAVILGNVTGSQSQLRINYQDITIRKVKAINVPTNFSSGSGAYGVWLTCTQAATGEATQNFAKRILIEDCDVYGGYAGFVVAGNTTGPGVVGYNTYLDDIRFNRCRHIQPAIVGRGANNGINPWGSSFQIGSRAYGGVARVSNCYSYGIGDTGVEINGMRDALVENTIVDDAAGYAFFTCNFNWPDIKTDGTAPATASPGQRIVYRNCHNRRRFGEAYGSAFRANTTLGIPLGSVVYEQCSYYRNATSPDWKNQNGEALGINAQIANVEIYNFKAEIEGVNYTDSVGVTPSLVRFDQSTVSQATLTIKNMALDIRGVRGGAAGSFTMTGIIFATGSWRLDCDGVTFSSAITGTTSGQIRGHDLAGTLTGDLWKFKVTSTGDDPNPRGLVIRGTATLTIPDKVTIARADFSGLPAGGIEILPATGVQNLNKFDYYNNRWIVYPQTPVTRTSNANIAYPQHEVMFGDATSGAITLTLPDATGIMAGKGFTIKRINTNANAVTLATTASQTIDGATTFALTNANEAVTVISDGANWRIV